MVINAPKSLSIAAALHPDVSDALDAALADAAGEIRSWLGRHSVIRVGPRGRQEVVPALRLGTVAVSHKTSRAGDPHRHIHFQIGTRVWAAGAWRGLDTAALFRQQGAIRALGTAIMAAHPALAAALDAHGLTLDPMTGEAAELQRFNTVMSKRGEQVAHNLARFEADWRVAHPGREPGPAAMSRLMTMAWDHGRPHKRPTVPGHEIAWRAELVEAGYRPNLARPPVHEPQSLDDVRVQEVASGALDRCAASASTWAVHDIQENVTRIITDTGVRADPTALHAVVVAATRLAASDCLSVLPPNAVHPEHVAHLTSVDVIADGHAQRDVTGVAGRSQLDPEQQRAAAAIAGTDRLVIVEGAAGAGKTTMLGVAIVTAAAYGRRTRIVTPTKKAADVAAQALGVPADSVAKLIHEHGWRRSRDGVWTRLNAGETDPATGRIYRGPSVTARLARGERIVVDEAGMLDQDTALALLSVADQYGASIALVGDRAQLPAVGRGGVLDIAAQLAGRTYDMTAVHRFTDPTYAALTVDLRRGEQPALLFDRLHALGLIHLHESAEAIYDAIACDAHVAEMITVATNDQAREINERIRQARARAGLVDDEHTTTGSDGLSIGTGDVIQTRHNDARMQVANRQTWTVLRVEDDGAVWAAESGADRKHQQTVRLSADYVAEHTHLAYASTAYGAQGATAPGSHTILSDALDAPGLYVGMTRGRHTNRLHIAAADIDDARAQFVAALERDRADRGLAAASRDARDAVTGLVADGPARTVRTERARLATLIEHADREAAGWEQPLAALDRQHETYRAGAEKSRHAVTLAEAHAAQVWAEIAAPLIERAHADGMAYVEAQTQVWQVNTAATRAGNLRKRTATRHAATATAATAAHGAARDLVRQRWGSIPADEGAVDIWAKQVAGERADATPRVIRARREADIAHGNQQEGDERFLRETAALRRELLGSTTSTTTTRHAAHWRARAEQARSDLAEIDTMPVTQAAQLAQQRAARADAGRESKVPSPTQLAPQTVRVGQSLSAHRPGLATLERDVSDR